MSDILVGGELRRAGFCRNGKSKRMGKGGRIVVINIINLSYESNLLAGGVSAARIVCEPKVSRPMASTANSPAKRVVAPIGTL